MSSRPKRVRSQEKEVIRTTTFSGHPESMPVSLGLGLQEDKEAEDNTLERVGLGGRWGANTKEGGSS